MANEFLRTMLTPGVRDSQRHYYGRAYPDQGSTSRPDELTVDEIEFLRARDSFYLATIPDSGWPYLQHRGGPRGFLTAPTPRQLVFADYGGNRQLISVGSVASNPRVCLFAIDYAARTRLKILGVAEVLDARAHADLVAASAPPGGHAADVERIVRITVHAFDWNCPKFITPRFTMAEVESVVAPLRARIAELQARVDSFGRAP
ncbi:MAG: pyridoxamine 5'-phosphate oxidase family protein [Planctomycetes bacterium]|nr:pyridoxamine 5'-phosphate oxidase family protein [Planctomycetota bacterium]